MCEQFTGSGCEILGEITAESLFQCSERGLFVAKGRRPGRESYISVPPRNYTHVHRMLSTGRKIAKLPPAD
jgi:hypothetical protein